MAFVFKAERKAICQDSETAKLHHVGPGSYMQLDNQMLKPQKSTKQPMQQQVGRNEQAKVSTASASQFTPGPGQYETTIAGQFSGIYNQSQSQKQLEHLGLNLGIRLIKPSATFASKKDRFDPTKKSNPGPGSYMKSVEWTVQKAKVIERSQSAILQSIVQQNAPSIPSHQHVFGYEENHRGELVKQSNSEVVLTGVGCDTAGPGSYEVAIKRKVPVVEWKQETKLPKKIQLIQQEKKGLDPGPGAYQKFESSSEKVRPVRQAVQLGGNKVKRMRSPIRKEDGPDVVEDSDDEFKTPGPGAYQQTSTFQVQRKPERLQYFGSTVSRFQEQERVNSAQANLGPGVYNLNPLNKPPINPKNCGFNSGEGRWTKSLSLKCIQEAQPQTPGPGAYHVQQLSKVIGKLGTFGSTERRFVVQDNLKTPGPGEYTDSQVHQRDLAKQLVQARTKYSASAKPKPKPKKEPQQVVQYDVDSKTIGEKIKRKIDCNPLLQQLKKQTSFSTQAPRWVKDASEEPEAFVGPGYYEMHGQFDKQTKASKSKFVSTAVRFSFKEPAQTPGPAHYEGQNKTWFKPSYNKNFIEA